ncbi:jg21985 [Pararge aegeria aegeria]|uniref:Jg21985 protein n=1 Tax=Pararge aegeria aegeria TaxID=348720 RepID=A0A8S4QW43_9NEOP|nr:jg21985 [Pararge aegeria aegeria]
MLKIDEVSFHCLTCNDIVLGQNSLTSHFTGDDHKKLYQACCEAYNKITVDKGPEKLFITIHNFNEKSKGQKKLNSNDEPILPCDQIKSHAIVESETKTKEVIVNDLRSDKIKVIEGTESGSEVYNHKIGKHPLKVIKETESTPEVYNQKIAKQPLNVIKETESAPEVYNQKNAKPPLKVIEETESESEVYNQKIAEQPLKVIEETESASEVSNQKIAKQPIRVIEGTESASEVCNQNIAKQPLRVIEETESASEVCNQNIANAAELGKEDNTKLKYVYDENDEYKICKSLNCTGYITTDQDKKNWCILCDWAMVAANISSHVKGKHHQTMLKLHIARLQKLKNNNKSVNYKEGAQNVESDEIPENLNKLQKGDAIVNSESNPVACNKSYTHVEVVNKTIESNILEHKKKHSVIKEGKSKAFDCCKESYMNKHLHDDYDDNKEIKKQNGNYDEIVEKLNEFQKNDININFESLSAYCKKCNTQIDFANKAIEKHILEHKLKPAKKKGKAKMFDSLPSKVSETKSFVTCPVLLKSNDTNNGENKQETTRNKKNDKVCSVISGVDTSKILEDIASSNDTENIPKNAETKSTSLQVVHPKTKKSKAVNLLKVPLKSFVHNVVALDNMMYKDVLINDKYCVNFFCFCFMVQVGQDKYRCQVCHECFRVNDCEFHCAKVEHAVAMHETPVIANDDSEFIREINPGSFLCGFCNMVEASWESMEAHLRSSGHKECKNAASWRKEVYQPRTEETDDFEQIVTDSVAMDMLMNRFL